MPVVEVVAKRFFKKLGREMAEDELAVFLFSYGLELDDIVSEREKHLKQTGIDDPRLSDEKLLKIEVPANRYDLLCEEGICRALNIFLGNFEMPQYQLTKSTQKIIVESSVDDVRPFVVCAILRNIDISDEVVYNNFIALQTKLHLTVCRKRTLASIGTHDLDTLQGPFVYKALPPQDIKFVPLNKTKEVDGHELMEVLKDSHLGPYLDIIKDKPRYPVIYDKNNVVMSVPPIINGEHSKIHSKTKNILVEVTATDLTKANIALNTVVTMFSEYCSKVFQIEQVETEYVTKKSVIAYPIFEKRDIECEVTYLSRGIGIEVDPTSVVGLLKKMGINSTLSKDKKNIVAEVSPTRTDIFHKCDLVEDVAIAFGFDKIPFNTPTTLCYGSQYQVNYISDKVRGEVARNGYTELLTFSLLSTEENYGMLNITEDSPYYKQCVVIANPATVEFQVARTSLLPGLLKTLENNKEVPVPLKVFEVSDVVFLDNSTDTGARNRRHLCAVFVNTTSSFEIVHSLLDKLMVAFNFKFKDQSRGYHIEHNDHPTYLKGRRGTIISTVNGVSKEIGYLGVLHPKVVLNFKLLHVVCALELDVQFLVDN